jgi:hypothetical protein
MRGLTDSIVAPVGPLVRGRSGEAPARDPRAVRCGGCGAEHEPRAWLALAPVEHLTGEAIAAHVVKWPKGLCIEIRRCSRCGRPIARTVESGR